MASSMLGHKPIPLEIGAPPRKQWTRGECRQMMELGLLKEAHSELVAGDIILKTPQDERHVFIRRQSYKALEDIFGAAFVRVAAPIAVGEHDEPEPDVTVVTRTGREYLQIGNPPPSDVVLAVEVSDSILHWDLRTKMRLYGSGGIPEYWVVDIPNRLLHVCREPTPDGYASVMVLTTNDEVRPLAAPDHAVRVADLLP